MSTDQGRLYGYGRVSTDEQNLARQIDALRERGVEADNIFQEKVSGAARTRPVFDHLVTEVLAPGDRLVVHDLDRLSRRTSRLILTVDELQSRGIAVESIREGVLTGSADGAFQVGLWALMAQRERDRIRERTQEGLAAAARRGKRPGRPVSVTPEQHETVVMLRALGKSYRQVAAATGLSASTVARISREDTPGHQAYRDHAGTHTTLHP